MSINIGIAGLGVVAQGVLDLLRSDPDALSHIVGDSVVVRRIASRKLRSEVDLSDIEFSTDLDDLVRDDELDVVIELIGGTDHAYDLIKACLNRGRAVITANKAVLAEHGNELLEFSREKDVPLAFEAAVAGGIPIIAALKTRFPGNQVQWIAGIINGTCNYILTAMTQEQASYEDALERAKELGYAEADPTFDVGGIDAGQKLAILVALAFNVPIEFSLDFCEGIDQVTSDDIRHADEFGYVIKHLAIGRQVGSEIEMGVYPALVPKGDLLGGVNDVENVVQVGTARSGVLRFTGPGAGGHATAASVVADLANIGANRYRHASVGEHSLQRLSMDNCESAYFLSLTVADQTGVIASIGEILARHGISIASLVQKQEEVHKSAESAVIPVAILTDVAAERNLNDAIAALESVSEIAPTVKKIRVAALES